MDNEHARKALDSRFSELNAARCSLDRPNRGWIRAVRTALGMSAVQLARRLNVTPARVGALEKGEVSGTVSLATLEKAAEALDCVVVYALLPRRPLQEMVKNRALRKAAGMIKRVDTTMALEAQNVGDRDLQDDLDELATELIRTRIRQLWDDQ